MNNSVLNIHWNISLIFPTLSLHESVLDIYLSTMKLVAI